MSASEATKTAADSAMSVLPAADAAELDAHAAALQARRFGSVRYAIDVFSALAASFCLSPFVTVIDRSIIENASGKRALKLGLKEGFKELLLRPWRLVARREFRLIWGVYLGTYTVANLTESLCLKYGISPEMPKFALVSVTNMTLSVLKDKALTRMFGMVAPKSLPLLSYVLFFMRDTLTIAFSFNMPKILSARLQGDGMQKSHADMAAQLFCPCAVQLLSTPLHLTALDMYNRPGARIGERAVFVRREYLKSATARIGRIAPAFGFGGIGNTYIKKTLQ